MEKLVVVSEFDTQILKLRRELDDIPAREQLIAAQTKDEEERCEAAKQSLSERLAKANQFDVEVKSEQQKILKLREQQLQLKTNQEFKAMENEIRTCEGKISRIEDSELESLDHVDSAKSALAEAKRDLEESRRRAGEQIAELQERKRGVEEQLAGLTSERMLAAREVDGRWLKHYERIMDNRKDVGLVAIEHGVCSGCNMTLPPHIFHAVKRGDAIVSCSFCGIMLY